MLRFGAICAAAVQDPLLVLPGRSESGLKASDEITDCFHVFGKRCLKTRSAERNMNKELRVSISAAEPESVIGQALKAAAGCEGSTSAIERQI